MTEQRSEKIKRLLGKGREGRVTKVKDGVVLVCGVERALMGELVVVELRDRGRYVPGFIMTLGVDDVGVVLLGSGEGVVTGAKVFTTRALATVPVGAQFLGRVVSPLGFPLDGKGFQGGFQSPVTSDALAFAKVAGLSPFGMDPEQQSSPDSGHFGVLEAPAPGIIERKSVCEPLHTGVVAVDAMVPIGRGQRQLIVGDRKVGKTSLGLDVILSQIREGSLDSQSSRSAVIGVYVVVGQKMSSVALACRLLETSAKAANNECWMVVVASASDVAAVQYLAPFSGVALAEFFMRSGRDVAVIYDDLTKHANAYREISLVLRRPPGREAFPPDIFYVHSRLLERAANLASGGSITAFPIVETQEGDVSAYIPTNVISITDGQIYLSESLFSAGVRPAIDVGISVSRVGSAAQTAAMKTVTRGLKLFMAQLVELEEFSSFSSDLDDRTVFKLVAFRRVRELLKQGVGLPIRVGYQIILLRIALVGGFQLVECAGVRGLGDLLVAKSHRYFPEVREGGLYPWELGGSQDGVLTEEGVVSIDGLYLWTLNSFFRRVAVARAVEAASSRRPHASPEGRRVALHRSFPAPSEWSSTYTTSRRLLYKLTHSGVVQGAVRGVVGRVVRKGSS